MASEYDTLVTPVEVEDLIAAALRYDSGAVGWIEAGSCLRGGSPPGQRRADHIYGDRGQIVLSNPLWLYTRTAGRWEETPLEQPRDPRAEYVEQFVQTVSEGEEPPITGEDGLATLSVIAAAYEAGEKHTVVTPPS